MLKAKRITSTDDVSFRKVIDLYEQSFPAVEKRDRKDNEWLLGDERFRLLALLDDEIFVGMAGVWDAGGMLYIEHLCTSPELRGKGYGAAALELFKASGKTVVLEIEPPENDLTKRRQSCLLQIVQGLIDIVRAADCREDLVFRFAMVHQLGDRVRLRCVASQKQKLPHCRLGVPRLHKFVQQIFHFHISTAKRESNF